MAIGKLHSIETFGALDGPGIRTVFFLQGCPARCMYCHNPDTWNEDEGEQITVGEVVSRARRGRPYYGENGGVTFSGGEPLLQADFLIEAMDALRRDGITSAIDTSGTYFDDKSETVIAHCDMVLLDIKHIDSNAHRRLTGWGNENILDCARYLSDIQKPVWIRHVSVPGINDDDESLRRLRTFLDTLGNVDRVEVLPYHTLGVYKWEQLGIPYTLAEVSPPDEESLIHVRRILTGQ